MVKAVNKLILEINNTENEYFEKAVFYIRPEKAADNKLSSSAEEYIKTVSKGAISTPKTKSSVMPTIIISTAAALFSATATAFVILLCG